MNTIEIHKTLLVEPVVMPNISYIEVGKTRDAAGKSLFYPNQHKGSNLERELTTKLNECSIEPPRPNPGSKTRKIRTDLTPDVTERRKQRTLPGKKADHQVENIILSLRKIESKLDMATGIKT
jgi:hypothetical protein